uniref:Uncharacterized protein n=1 Tax=Nelumbo nucifera TaxID=4432 RepID=A0A822YB25_NELNU|nr:TPA_asm: hypothetical protein HUJ06_030791 [Nelumbo nucifera]
MKAWGSWFRHKGKRDSMAMFLGRSWSVAKMDMGVRVQWVLVEGRG